MWSIDLLSNYRCKRYEENIDSGIILNGYIHGIHMNNKDERYWTRSMLSERIRSMHLTWNILKKRTLNC